MTDSAEAEYSLLEFDDGQVLNYRGNESKGGRRFKLENATWKGSKNRFTWRGANPSQRREWIYDHKGMEAALERGELYLRDPNVGSSRCVKRYLDDVKGIPLQDIWDEVGRMKGGSDCPTQKPERLLERIVNIGSKEGDLVADFFCGSGAGIGGVLEGFELPQQEIALPEFEERWTGGYIFENEWQSFRTRQSRDLELLTAEHDYEKPGRYTVAVKVIDIFGNDTMTLVPVNVG